MLTLKRLKGNTHYIPSPTNIGVYIKVDEAILIDSGNDKEAGRYILRLLKDFKLKLIINTHSNADHIGGNSFIQSKTDCRIAASRIEAPFIQDPILEASFLYGGYPLEKHHNKFLVAKPSNVTDIIGKGKILDTDLFASPLPGHYFGMLGIRTPDNVFFIADSLFPNRIITKYHLFYILDVQRYLDTLKLLETSDADIYVPSHGEPSDDIKGLIEANRSKIQEIASTIGKICEMPKTSEEILADVCGHYKIRLNENQYLLVLSTIRSYLSYMSKKKLLSYYFNEGRMLWSA